MAPSEILEILEIREILEIIQGWNVRVEPSVGGRKEKHVAEKRERRGA